MDTWMEDQYYQQALWERLISLPPDPVMDQIYAAAYGITDPLHLRMIRASTGAYGGYVNGQQFGGTYYAPDNGPPVHHRYGPNQEPHRGSSSNYKPNLQNRFGDSQNEPPRRPTGSGSGSFAGASAGSFGGAGGNYGSSTPEYYPFSSAQTHPFKSPYEFNEFLQNFFLTFNNNLASTFQKNADIQRDAFMAATHAFNEAAKQRFGGVPNLNYGGYGGASSGAFSSGSLGSSGGFISTGVYPENPSKPNIHTRFGNDNNNNSKPGGNIVGISTSAFSSTSDVNGKKTTQKQATTSINENGKVTTYTVEN